MRPALYFFVKKRLKCLVGNAKSSTFAPVKRRAMAP